MILLKTVFLQYSKVLLSRGGDISNSWYYELCHVKWENGLHLNFISWKYRWSVAQIGVRYLSQQRSVIFSIFTTYFLLRENVTCCPSAIFSPCRKSICITITFIWPIPSRIWKQMEQVFPGIVFGLSKEPLAWIKTLVALSAYVSNLLEFVATFDVRCL